MVQQFKWNIFCIVFPFLLEHNDNGIPLVAPLDLEDKKTSIKSVKGSRRLNECIILNLVLRSRPWKNLIPHF